ncbi:MAG TPA: PfkB family carbohydrate kinase [Caulobacteraceae bacterium]|nr:PfkB family carbohydrate kinase [Caulobacteraceae bacterium]
MPAILILSSFVASSRVGGSAQALALARLGIEPILAPTVLLGRHPGLGAPGGAAVEAATMAAMLDAVEANGRFGALDAVITGHFSHPDQARLAAQTLRRVKAASPGARLIVDPVMGDAPGGLYVGAAVAEAIARELAPLADLLAPNAFELERLSGAPITGEATALAAATRLGRPVLVSSVPSGAEIGVVYAEGGRGWLAAHARAPAAPKGCGDLLTAFFAAALVQGFALHDALQAAVGALAEMIADGGGGDPAIGSLPTRLAASARVRLEAVHG